MSFLNKNGETTLYVPKHGLIGKKKIALEVENTPRSTHYTVRHMDEIDKINKITFPREGKI